MIKTKGNARYILARRRPGGRVNKQGQRPRPTLSWHGLDQDLGQGLPHFGMIKTRTVYTKTRPTTILSEFCLGFVLCTKKIRFKLKLMPSELIQ